MPSAVIIAQKVRVFVLLCINGHILLSFKKIWLAAYLYHHDQRPCRDERRTDQ